MLAKWYANNTTSGASTVATVHNDARKVAIHVLARVGLGMLPQDFSRSRQAELAAGSAHCMPYGDALVGILSNQRLVGSLNLLVPWWPRASPSLFRSRLVPARVRYADACTREFRCYMEDVLVHARNNNHVGGGAQQLDRNTLVAALLRSSDEQASPRQRLSDAEVMGNLYMFNVAGHATTANLIAFALTLLSVHQDVQDWLREELQTLLGSDDDTLVGRLRELFPNMVRMQAVQNETLRLYGTAFVLRVATQPTVMTLSSDYMLAVPAGASVLLDTSSVEKAPAWSASGYPARSWAPRRWIQADLETGKESLVQPSGVTYLPFAAGPRTCPGKRVAQVASAAVLGTVLKQWYIKPALRSWTGVPPLGNISEREDSLAAEEIRKSLMTAGLTTDDISVTIPTRHRPTLRIQKLA